MEKEKLFVSEENTISPTWNSSILGIGIHSNQLNCGSERLPNSFFNPNWENSPMGQSDPFESALSSMVSSPETNTSCYSTPLNSPPKLNLSMIMDHQIRGNSRIPGNHFPSLSTDPGFADRAARFSSLNSQFGFREHRLDFGNLPKDQSARFSVSPVCVNLSPDKKSARLSRSSTPENGESSVSEQIPDGEIGINGQTHANPKKRKSIPRGKGKETPSFPTAKEAKDARESDESNAKRSKVEEFSGKGKAEESENGKQAKENAKPQEPPKDYIHVRARRGQATDSHSLAERVRREKISERMKFLQDLVPGCNKVTGKAVMLDEIINYVQSLQHQVEFLSMKLATVNPRTEFNMEAFVSKDNFPSRGSVPHGIFPFPYEYQSPQGQGPSLHSGIPHGFGQAASQHSTIWEDDLQSFVQMGFVQNQLQNIHGTMGTSQMKIEQ